MSRRSIALTRSPMSVDTAVSASALENFQFFFLPFGIGPTTKFLPLTPFYHSFTPYKPFLLPILSPTILSLTTSIQKTLHFLPISTTHISLTRLLSFSLTISTSAASTLTTQLSYYLHPTPLILQRPTTRFTRRHHCTYSSLYPPTTTIVELCSLSYDTKSRCYRSSHFLLRCLPLNKHLLPSASLISATTHKSIIGPPEKPSERLHFCRQPSLTRSTFRRDLKKLHKLRLQQLIKTANNPPSNPALFRQQPRQQQRRLLQVVSDRAYKLMDDLFLASLSFTRCW